MESFTVNENNEGDRKQTLVNYIQKSEEKPTTEVVPQAPQEGAPIIEDVHQTAPQEGSPIIEDVHQPAQQGEQPITPDYEASLELEEALREKFSKIDADNKVKRGVRDDVSFVNYNDVVKTLTTTNIPVNTNAPVLNVSAVKVRKMTSEKKNVLINDNISGVIDKFTTSQIVAPQSGYMAIVQGLTTYETLNLQEPDGIDLYTKYKNRFRIIYDKIIKSSAQFKSFNEFADNTTMGDEETLYFALFNATHPSQNTYPIPCNSQKCKGKPFDYEANTEDLITEVDDETVARILDIVNNPRTKELYYDNNDFTKSAIRLSYDNGHTLFDISIPTISKFLERVANKIESKYAVKYEKYLSYIPFIDAMYIYQETDEDGVPVYISFSPENNDEVEAIFKRLVLINDDEFVALKQQLDKLENRYTIKFGIRECKCPECGTEYKNVPIKFDDMLFTILQKKLEVANQK